jgi:hypothetical protein
MRTECRPSASAVQVLDVDLASPAEGVDAAP